MTGGVGGICFLLPRQTRLTVSYSVVIKLYFKGKLVRVHECRRWIQTIAFEISSFRFPTFSNFVKHIRTNVYRYAPYTDAAFRSSWTFHNLPSLLLIKFEWIYPSCSCLLFYYIILFSLFETLKTHNPNRIFKVIPRYFIFFWILIPIFRWKLGKKNDKSRRLTVYVRRLDGISIQLRLISVILYNIGFPSNIITSLSR